MTVQVKAYGVPEAIYNGQRDKVVESIRAEMLRQRDALNAEMDSMRREMERKIAIERSRADDREKAHCRMLGEKLSAITEGMQDNRGPVRRAIETAFEMAWASVRCWLGIGETMRL